MAANAAAEVSARLKVIARRASSAAPRAAVQALGRAGETMTKLTLSKRTHPAGTPTPSAPGSPPALVSGKLRRAVHRAPAVPAGPARWTQVQGCLVIYGSVHEFGPVVIRVKSKKVLASKATGQVFGPGPVTIPRRPWVKPSMEALISSGLGTKAANAAFLKVIDA